MERIKRGYVLINGKKHFIYEGLNIIGRNKGAAVTIPDTSVSHYHSNVIVIDNRHYIGDINSSNGTFLDGHTLTPLKLYELDHENVLKFGLVNAKYMKLVSSNTQDDSESYESNSLQYEEHIFVAKTQIYDIPKSSSQNLEKPTIQLHELSQSKSENKNTSQNSVALSINDMPTQIMENRSDEELTTNSVIEKKNSCNGENYDLVECVSINDMPTQIVVLEDDMSLLERVDHCDTISNIIDETVVENNNDENSNESTDFLTMQPATQRFGSEAESQLFVQQLQRRVRNIICSSDEDSSNCGSQKNDANKITIQNPASSGEETDIDCAQIRKKKFRKKNKPIIASDSDGDSTDAEGANVVSDPIGIPQLKDDKSDDSDTDVETSSVTKMTTDTKIHTETVLDDSDIIQTTQQDVASVINTAKDTIETVVEEFQTNNNENKNVIIDDNQETTLTDSFHLVLTNTQRLEDGSDIDKINTKEEQFITSDKQQLELISTSINTNDEALVLNSLSDKITKNKEVNEEPQTQLEVSFDDNLEQSAIDSGRPQNPLISVLKDSGSLELDDSIEDKLAKMFQTQTSEEAPPKKSEDEIFAQPTQIVNKNDLNDSLIEKDVFLIPTQRIVPKRNTKKNSEAFKNGNEEDDDLFFKPTQIIANNPEPAPSTAEPQEADEDIFAKPTQVLDDTPDINVPISKKNINVDVVEDDVFLQPTQIVTDTSETTEDVTNNVRKSESLSTGKEAAIVKSTENLEDDIFLLSTQIVDVKSDESSKRSNVLENNVSIDANIQQVSRTKDCYKDVETYGKKDSALSKSKGENFNTTNTAKLENMDILKNDVPLKQKDPTASTDGAEMHDVNVKKGYHKEEELAMEIDNNNIDKNILPTVTCIYVKNEESVNEKTKSEVAIAADASEDTSKRKQTKQLVPDSENKKTKKQKTENDDNSEVNTSKVKKIPTKSALAVSINESRPLRRTRRKNSNDEKLEVAETDLQVEILPVIQETPLLSDAQIIPTNNQHGEVNSHASENSEDEFVDTKLQTPLRTRRTGRQTSSVKNKKTKHSTSTNALAINDQVISSGSRTKRKSPDIEIGNSKIASEGEISESNVQNVATPIKKRKVQQRVIKTRKLSITERGIQPEDIEVKHEPSSSMRGKTNVNNILFEPSTSSIPSETVNNKIRTSSRRKNKSIAHAADENSSDTNPDNSDIHEKHTKEDNNGRELSEDSINTTIKTRKSKKAEKAIQETCETSESSSEPTSLNASSSKTRKYTARKRKDSTTSNISTVTVESTNSHMRKSRRRNSITNSEDDFEPSAVKKEQITTNATPSTPNRNKRILKPKVVFTMLESPQLETIIRSLGGFVVDSIETSTVLLTTNVKRSQKLLSAVGLSKPICSPKWLHDSKKSNKFLDPWDYILEDEEAETKWNFSLKESLRRSGNTKLLKDYTFLIMTNTAQDVLRGSIESCGGKCVSRAPSKGQQTNFIIVASPDSKSKYSKYIKQKTPPTIIAPEAVFDGVLRQELHFENHLLT